MDLDFVSVHKHAKKELGQYPVILTSRLVNNPYLFAEGEGEVIIGEYSPRRSRGEYSPIITSTFANNCFRISTQVIILKKREKKTFQRKIIFTYSGKTTTGSHFVRRGDYRLIIRDSEPMRARDFV